MFQKNQRPWRPWPILDTLYPYWIPMMPCVSFFLSWVWCENCWLSPQAFGFNINPQEIQKPQVTNVSEIHPLLVIIIQRRNLVLTLVDCIPTTGAFPSWQAPLTPNSQSWSAAALSRSCSQRLALWGERIKNTKYCFPGEELVTLSLSMYKYKYIYIYYIYIYCTPYIVPPA